ncbi:hypothetical protein GBA52_021979 [Prunus armeniaca]|nr:hypothetical protein GBA52_021979 [Prunus armeniaca]
MTTHSHPPKPPPPNEPRTLAGNQFGLRQWLSQLLPGKPTFQFLCFDGFHNHQFSVSDGYSRIEFESRVPNDSVAANAQQRH